jgi:hypothetical protein
MKSVTVEVNVKELVSMLSKMKPYDVITFDKEKRLTRKHNQTASQFINAKRRGSIH